MSLHIAQYSNKIAHGRKANGALTRISTQEITVVIHTDGPVPKTPYHPAECSSLHAWIAESIIPLLPPDEVHRILAACIARQLNPDL